MKKTIFFLMIFVLMFSVTSHAFEYSLLNEEGFADVSQPYYHCKGLMEIHKIGETAIIDKYGNIVSDFESREKALTPNGLFAILGDNNKIGFADKSGNMITDFEYDAFVDVHEKTGEVNVGYLTSMYFKGDGSSDLIPVSKDGRFGYINSKGEVVIPLKYDYAYGFVGGIARICADGVLSDYGTYTECKYGFIREDGTEICPADSYWIAGDFDTSLGYAEASNGENHRVLIDGDGNVALCDENGYAKINAPYIVFSPSENVYGVYDSAGKVIIPPVKSDPIVVKGDRFLVANTLRNSYNEILYEAPEDVMLFCNNDNRDIIITVYKPRGTWDLYIYGCIDFDGNVLFDIKYDSITPLGDGLLRIRDDREYILASTDGRVILTSEVDSCFAYDGFITLYDVDSRIAYIANNPLKRPAVYLDDERVYFTDAHPYFEGERTMIPLRSVFEKAGANVGWDPETGIVCVEKDGIRVSMKIGEKTITIGDKVYESDTAPVAIDNRTYIPLRVFSEGIGMNVVWDGETNSVYLES